jgi:hypothetical protein
MTDDFLDRTAGHVGAAVLEPCRHSHWCAIRGPLRGGSHPGPACSPIGAREAMDKQKTAYTLQQTFLKWIN